MCRSEASRCARRPDRPGGDAPAILGADAVLVAGAAEPALGEVMSELDLRAR